MFSKKGRALESLELKKPVCSLRDFMKLLQGLGFRGFGSVGIRVGVLFGGPEGVWVWVLDFS